MLDTTSNPSTGWTHAALFLLLWIKQPVGTSPQGPWVSQQPQEPSSHTLDHWTDAMDGIETHAHLVCIQYKM